MSLYTELSGKIIVEFAADEPTTIFEDDAGTDAAEDTDAVHVWKTTANGSLATQGAEATNCPTYDADVGDGKPAIVFDGTNDLLTVADHADLDPASAMHLFVVVTLDSITGDKGIVTKVNGAWDTGWAVWTPCAWGISYTTRNLFNVSTATRYILSCRAVTGSGTSDPMLMGSVNGGFFAACKIHHILVCSSLTLDEENNAIYYLWDRWNPSEARLMDSRSMRAQPDLIVAGGGVFLATALNGGCV